MASIWLWAGIIFGSLLLGLIIFAFLYLVFTKMKDWKIKRKIPKDKKLVKDYIETNKEFFKSPPKEIIDIKEVEDNDRRRNDRFREFEKLRRLANPDIKKPANGKDKPGPLSPGDTKPKPRIVLSDEPNKIVTGSNTNRPRTKGRVKLD